jgi:hypothetical protein
VIREVNEIIECTDGASPDKEVNVDDVERDYRPELAVTVGWVMIP